MKNKNLIVGAGGHAKVIQAELTQKKQTLFLTQDSKQKADDTLLEQEQNLEILKSSYDFYFGVGGVDSLSMKKRESIFENFSKSITFKNFISSKALVEHNQLKNTGCVVMKGAVVQHNVKIGSNVILNTSCVVEHDSSIGDHCHIGPNATICGNVLIGTAVLIGAGSTVIQGLTIGNKSVLAAGSVLTQNIPANEVWAGVPASKIKAL